MPEFPYYPLKVGNVWTYINGDGTVYTNEVTEHDALNNRFKMVNSVVGRPVTVFVDEEGLKSDAIEGGKFLLMLKSNPQVGDTWTLEFIANTLQNQLVATVKQTDASVGVEGQTYSNVLIVETESKVFVNGSWMSINYLTQYNYAAGVGLVLTTSSHGDRQALTKCELC